MVACAGALAQNAIRQPADIFAQFFTFKAQFLFDVINQRMGQHVDALKDHLIDSDISIVAALTK